MTERITWFLAAALLVWMGIGITLAQWRMAPTYDEQNHVTRGISVLRTGDYRLCFHHPPLANLLEALPVAWRGDHGFTTDMEAWKTLGIWQAARTTIWSRAADGAYHGVELIRLARLPVLLFTLGLGVLIFLWSRALFGPWGGVISLALFAFDPTMLAHGGLATTDMAAACTILLGLYLLRGYLTAPGRGRLLWAGVGLGLALTAKFSGLVLVPIIGLVLLLLALKPEADGLSAAWAAHPWFRRVGQALVVCALLGLIGAGVVWGMYGFHVEARGAKPGQPVSDQASLSQRLPVPAMQYFRGLKTVKAESKGHPAYLLGQGRSGGRGWWYYFPVAMAVKLPLTALLLLVGGVLLLAVPAVRARLSRRDGLLLLIPVGVFLLMAFGMKMNLGVRHVLPIFPFLMILAGGWAVLPVRGAMLPAALAVVLGLQTASVGTAFPNFLSYFNEAAGGARDGYRYLVDSNLDWGQDLARLAEAQQRLKLKPLYLSYFGSTPPEAFGIDALPVSGFSTYRAPHVDLAHTRGFLAISITNLAGGPAFTGGPADPGNPRNGQDFRALLPYVPYERVGDTILIYDLPPSRVPLPR
jgi:hypothetical protein